MLSKYLKSVGCVNHVAALQFPPADFIPEYLDLPTIFTNSMALSSPATLLTQMV